MRIKANTTTKLNYPDIHKLNKKELWIFGNNYIDENSPPLALSKIYFESSLL